ncbi:MAG: TonB family protein [Marinibacterium sp.]|nr:TonB family protein [Marinibacterium sp.]
MKRLAEILIFAVLAVALHVAVFAARPTAGTESGGAGGDALVSLEAAEATVAEMVEAWDTARTAPPPVIKQPDITPPDIPQAPQAPQINLAEAPRADMKLAALPQIDPDQVQIDSMALRPPDPPPPPAVIPPPPPTPVTPPEPLADDPATDRRLESSPRPPVRPKRLEPPTPRKAPPVTKPQPQPDQGRKAATASAGRAAQKAAGSGGRSQAGSASASVGTASAGQAAKLQQVWGAKIRARVERAKRYPRGTNASGNVKLRIRVNRNGRLASVTVRASSGDARLDQAAVAAVKRAGRFPPAPKKLKGDSFGFNLTLKLQRR